MAAYQPVTDVRAKVRDAVLEAEKKNDEMVKVAEKIWDHLSSIPPETIITDYSSYERFIFYRDEHDECMKKEDWVAGFGKRLQRVKPSFLKGQTLSTEMLAVPVSFSVVVVTHNEDGSANILTLPTGVNLQDVIVLMTMKSVEYDWVNFDHFAAHLVQTYKGFQGPVNLKDNNELFIDNSSLILHYFSWC